MVPKAHLTKTDTLSSGRSDFTKNGPCKVLHLANQQVEIIVSCPVIVDRGTQAMLAVNSRIRDHCNSILLQAEHDFDVQ